MQDIGSQRGVYARILGVLCCFGVVYLLAVAVFYTQGIPRSSIASTSTDGIGTTTSTIPSQSAVSSSLQTATAPSLDSLPSYCPAPSTVTSIVAKAFPNATFNQAYSIDPAAHQCAAAPTLVFPKGGQLAVVIVGDKVVSTSTLRAGSDLPSNSGLARWSGYESSHDNETVIEAGSSQMVPSTSAPPTYSSENSTMQGNCCALSIWTGQTDAQGGIADGKLIQIGIDLESAGLRWAFGYEYVGFYEMLPGVAVLFNSTQVPCGMPEAGQSYSASVTNDGQYNSSMWQYALVFKNNSCSSGFYVVYTLYDMHGTYAEFQTEAPTRCLFSEFMFQTQPPRFSGDNVSSAAVSFDNGGREVAFALGQTRVNSGVIDLDTGSDTMNTSPANGTGQYSTIWLSSASNLNFVAFC